ncbi:uncharacterized protein LOC112598284 [Melanaphis sacchari]|uniref:uncharacterized protein LOC112598284 n=1 Tax=Melanaphis sacchari TaxID=742174 RepID=UPI000DC1550A|nr:uncharacterized protein LOC112598284 [Melanaphis sacchari]
MSLVPLFLTNKIKIQPLEHQVYDFQLRDHFLSTEDVFFRKCLCGKHAHRKVPCFVSNDRECKKCGTAFELLIRHQSLLFHRKTLETCRVFRCCVHKHDPPCSECINCKTGSPCVVKDPYYCDLTTDVTCVGPKFADGRLHSTTLFEHDLFNHLFDLRVALFYFCKRHAHRHEHDNTVPCTVQTFRCCDEAVYVTDFKQSFLLVVDNKKYVVYDPSLWREQSTNHFASLVRAAVLLPNAVPERYKRFETSNFKVSSIKKYKSGKQSVVRTAVTGFEVKAIYQTATISCDLPSDAVMIPQRIWDMMKNEYDLNLVCIKRDPCIKSTCMFVCKAIRNPDPGVDVIVINDAVAKPMNQDVDGDKNAVYALPKHTRQFYDRYETFLHKLSKYEMSVAYARNKTLIGLPRFSFSENARLLIYRNAQWLRENNEFFNRTHGHGLEYMIEAGCGYLKSEYDEFCMVLRNLNETRNTYCITVDDLLQTTDTVSSVVQSGAKGHEETMKMFFDRLYDNSTSLSENQQRSAIEQMNRYIVSGQRLRQTGRTQFILIYCESELKSSFGTVFLNSTPYVDFKPLFSNFAFMFNEASLNECIKDLKNCAR